jgi:Ser/Thr protein kinase RdoA (MazF antagonist)
VIADLNNTVVLLPAERVVVKVATSGLEGRGGDALELELAVGRRLAARGAPAAAPIAGEAAGPHRVNGAVVTLWHYLERVPRPADGDRRLGGALRSFHVALCGMEGELPSLTEKVTRARALFADPAATPEVPAADREMCARAGRLVAALLDEAGGHTCLHSEPHDGNVVWTSRGPALIDFEAVCVGPLEWDLAYLPDTALDAFPERDCALVDRLRGGVSFCVAAWCSASLDRGDEMRSAAGFHLAALRQSGLAN